MIVDERIITFINSMDTENSEILETIEQEALSSDVPIIRREMQSFLEVLLLMKKPMRVLEVGTAVGFSALLMSDYLPEGGHITTIENYEKRIPIARENFRRAGKEDKITLIEGDATEVLAEMEGTFDFIFMDAAKGQYIHYLPNVTAFGWRLSCVRQCDAGWGYHRIPFCGRTQKSYNTCENAGISV